MVRKHALTHGILQTQHQQGFHLYARIWRARNLTYGSRNFCAVVSEEVDNQSCKSEAMEAEVSGDKVDSNPTRADDCCNVPLDSGPKLTHEAALDALEALLDRVEVGSGRGDARLGIICLRLAQLCDGADLEPARILSFGQRALKFFKAAEESWERAMCLHAIGYALFKMSEVKKAVGQLEESAAILEKLKVTKNLKQIKNVKQAGQALLGEAKRSVGRHQEAVHHFKRSVELCEKNLEPGNPDLGKAYFQAAQAFKEAKDLEEAICFCIKALENHANYYGPNSLQAAKIRRYMSFVHFDYKEYDNALAEYNIVRPIFEGLGKEEEVVSLDLLAVESLFQLDKVDEAITKLNGVINGTEETNLFHGKALVLLAKAYAILKKVDGATYSEKAEILLEKQSTDLGANCVSLAMVDQSRAEYEDKCASYCRKALGVLEKQKASTDLGASWVTLALVYQRQEDYEKATSAYKRALEIYNKFSGHEAEAATADIEGQIGFLMLMLEKAEEALPYLEGSVSKKKTLYGEEREETLDVYNHLGLAYSQVGKLDEALVQFEAAKAILSKPAIEIDSLAVSIYNNLANMYSVFGRLDEAIECQKLVVDAIKRGADEEGMICLEEAEKILQDFLQEADARKSSQ